MEERQKGCSEEALQEEEEEGRRLTNREFPLKNNFLNPPINSSSAGVSSFHSPLLLPGQPYQTLDGPVNREGSRQLTEDNGGTAGFVACGRRRRCSNILTFGQWDGPGDTVTDPPPYLPPSFSPSLEIVVQELIF